MTPRNPFDLLAATPRIDSLVRKNKKARKAMKKMARKLEMARRAKNVTEIRLLLGMGQVALDKAEFLAKTAK